MTVLAADDYRTNADLIQACRELGYIKDTDHVLDPTYGKGVWWSKWRPEKLIHSDIDAVVSVDFREMEWADGEFDVIAYDPPFVSIGGRRGSRMDEMYDRYGLKEAPRSPAELQVLINDGLSECTRVLRRGGLLLCKCQDYVSSGKLWSGTYRTQYHATEVLGLETVDRLERVGRPRPQPQRPRQVHARRNLSTLFVFRKKK